jgi:hypothetical protein
MADQAIAITAGTGTNVDTRTEATNGNHRQVVVLGDPATNAGVAPVDGTAGLKVDLGADNDVTVTGTVTATGVPATSGGLLVSSIVSAGSTNATVAKASAGQVYNIQVSNTNAAARYLKLYNKATAPTVGTDTPVWRMAIPGNTAGAGFIVNADPGIAFGTGISYALTTGAADSDTGAVAANEILVNISYK